MDFKDPVAYLVIKVWIKSKLPKIGLMKIKNPNGPIVTKKLSPTRGPKFSLINQKELVTIP